MGSPTFYNYRNPRMTELLAMGGDAQADYARRQAEMWAGALGGVGQAVGGAIQQHQEQKQLRRNEEAVLSTIGSYDPADPDGPKKLMMNLTRIQGDPRKAAQTVEAVVRFNKKDEGDAKAELEGMAAGLDWITQQSDAVAAQAWPLLRQRYAASAGKVKLPDLGDQWDPSFREQLKPTAGLLGAIAGKIPAKVEAPKPGSFEAFAAARGADTPEAMLAARTDWESAGRAPVAPPKPEKTLAEKVAEARAISAAHAQGVADVRAKEPGEEFALNPEGVVLTGYGKKQTDAVRQQAKERGLPVFENTTTQIKGMALKGIVDEAKELKDLLEDAEVAAVIGPALSNPVKALRRASGGLIDLDPKAQRALQLAGMLSDSELRKRSGASAGEAEMKRILGFAISPTMPIGNLKTNLNGMLKAGARDYKALSGIDIGLPAEREVVRRGTNSAGKRVVMYSDGTIEEE